MRAGVIVIARMGATRRPGKMLADIGGRPLLLRLLDRLRLPDETLPVILATTVEAEDDVLAAAAATAGCRIYRGSTDDVLERVVGAAAAFDVDVVALVEGDEFFTDRALVDQALATVRGTGADAAKVRGVPIGAWVMAATPSALAAAGRRKGAASSDGWSRFLFSVPEAHTVEFDPEPPLPAFDERLRMTMDHDEDLAFACAVQARLDTRRAAGTLHEVLDVVNAEPSLIDINAFLTAEYWQRLRTRAGLPVAGGGGKDSR